MIFRTSRWAMLSCWRNGSQDCTGLWKHPPPPVYNKNIQPEQQTDQSCSYLLHSFTFSDYKHVKCFSGFPKFSKVSRFPEFLLLRRAGAHRHAGVWQGHPASAGGLNLPCQLFECHPGPGGVVKCHGLAITFPSS